MSLSTVDTRNVYYATLGGGTGGGVAFDGGDAKLSS